MAETSWPMSETTQENLQNLVSQGYMIPVELATCRVPVDPASPAPVGGYVMPCMAFYEQGFGAPSHQFLRLLLQFYSLELHHLTPSGASEPCRCHTRFLYRSQVLIVCMTQDQLFHTHGQKCSQITKCHE
jgi:hypothetical protein